MSESEPVDTVGPWNIKSVPSTTRLAVTSAARKEGLTVGQWLEKHVAEWIEDGSPVQVGGAGGSAGPVLEMLANMGRAGVPVQKGVGALANRLVRRELRGALGLGTGATPTAPRLAAPEPEPAPPAEPAPEPTPPATPKAKKSRLPA